MERNVVGIRELKAHLSEYLRRVKAGETITVTDHGKPIGIILPIREEPAERMRTLVAAGLFEWNGQSVPASEPKAVNRGPGLISDLVIDNR